MTVDEAKLKWCCTHELEKCNANNCMPGGGLTRRLRMTAIAVWQVRRVRSDFTRIVCRDKEYQQSI